MLIGINLLREGLDIPEVALVAVLDADKEGFLRNSTSLIQTIGRAARNVDGRVLLYADTVTRSMSVAMEETRRRREKQLAYNKEHGITPASIVKALSSPLADLLDAGTVRVAVDRPLVGAKEASDMTVERLPGTIKRLRNEMKRAAQKLDFERAADLRDRIRELESWAIEVMGAD